MDERTEAPGGVRCPVCAGERVRWRVRRAPRFGPRGQRNALEWTCADCGTRWDDAPGDADEAGCEFDGPRPGGRAVRYISTDPEV